MEAAPDDAGLKHQHFMGLDIFLAYLSDMYFRNVDVHLDQARNASNILFQRQDFSFMYFAVWYNITKNQVCGDGSRIKRWVSRPHPTLKSI